MAKTLDELIAENNVDEAVDRVYRGLIRAFNTYCPGITLTKESLAVIAGPLKDKILGVEKKEEDPEDKYIPSDETGDDIIVKPSRAPLLIQFEINDPKIKAPDDIVGTYAVGQEFYFEAPEIEGYTADLPIIEGKMTSKGYFALVRYVKNPVEEEEEEEEAEETKYGKATIMHYMCKCKDSGCKDKKCCTVEGRKTAHTVITIRNAVFDFKKANTGGYIPTKEYEGWVMGFNMEAPCAKECDSCESCEMKGKIRASLPDGGFAECALADVCKGDEECGVCKDGEKPCVFKIKRIITPALLSEPNTADGMLTFFTDFDWDGDGIFEQRVELKFDPSTITLNLKGNKDLAAWPVGAKAVHPDNEQE